MRIRLKEVIQCCQFGGVQLDSITSQLPRSVPRSRVSISPIQMDVLAVLRVIYTGQKVVAEHTIIEELDLTVDAYIEHLDLAVETDGAFHRPKFLEKEANTMDWTAEQTEEKLRNWQTTRTLLRSGLIQESCTKLMRVSDLEWNTLKGFGEKQQYLVRRLQTVLRHDIVSKVLDIDREKKH